MLIGSNLKEKVQKGREWVESHAKGLFVAAVLIQVICMIAVYSIYGVVFGGDTFTYIIPAESFLEQGIMMSGDMPIMARTPGYPLMLAIIYGIVGENNAAVVAVQAVMSILTGVMVYSIIGMIAKSKALALGGLYYWTIYFGNYYYACNILTEVPFEFFFVLSLWIFCKYLQDGKFYLILLSFASLHFALLIRPAIVYYCMIILAVLLLLAVRKKVRWRTAVAFLLLFVVTYGGWSMRNNCYFGSPVYSTIRNWGYFYDFGPRTYQVVEHGSWEEGREYLVTLRNERYPDYAELSPMDQVRAETDIGKGYIEQHIGAYILVNLHGLLKELIAPNMTEIYQLELPYAVTWLIFFAEAGILLLLYLIYAVGFFKNLKRLTWFDFLVFLTNAYMMAGHAVVGYARYRMYFWTTCVIGAFLCWRNDLRPIYGSIDS